MPLIRLRARHQALRQRPGRTDGAERHRPRHQRRRVRRDHGAERIGQIDRDEHPRLPRHAQRRAVPVPWRACRSAVARPARAAAPSLSGLRVPGLQPAGAHLGAGERRTAAAVPRRERGDAACGRGQGAAVGGPGRLGTSHPGRVVRRAAAARGHRPRHRHRTGRAAGRRADRQPRHPAQPGDHGTAARPEYEPRHHRADGHPRTRHGGLCATPGALPRWPGAQRCAESASGPRRRRSKHRCC